MVKDVQVYIMEYVNNKLETREYTLNHIPKKELEKEVMEIISDEDYIEIYVK